MQKNIWSNRGMLGNGEKKGEPLSVKVQPSLLETLKAIGRKEDRGVGYVARELMLRGLHLLMQDGRLKVSDTELADIAQNTTTYRRDANQVIADPEHKLSEYPYPMTNKPRTIAAADRKEIDRKSDTKLLQHKTQNTTQAKRRNTK